MSIDQTGYDYAAFVNFTCSELRYELHNVIPVVSEVYRKRDSGPRWDKVLCHPDDKGKTDEKEFIHPFRDI